MGEKKKKPKAKKDELVYLNVRIPLTVKKQYKQRLASVDETMQNHVLLMILHYLQHGDFSTAKA